MLVTSTPSVLVPNVVNSSPRKPKRQVFVGAEKVQESIIVIDVPDVKVPSSWNAVVWMLVLFPFVFHICPVVIWLSFTLLYQSNFGISPTYSCLIQAAGDLSGSILLLVRARSAGAAGAAETNVRHRSRMWCLRTPRNISTNLIFLGLSMFGMASSLLPIVVVSHYFTGVFYVMLSQAASASILAYSKNGEMHQKVSSTHMTIVMLTKIIGGASVPFLYAMNSRLPFYLVGSFSYVGAVVVALIFAHRIRTTFGPEESFCSLSQSLYKLESKKMMLYYKNKQPTTGGTEHL